MLVEDLEPHIREVILSTPPDQLSTITAREVRAQLVARITGVDKDWVKENKVAINELIGSVFEQLVPPAEDAGTAVKAEDDGAAAAADGDDDDDADGGPSTPPAKHRAGGGGSSKPKKSAKSKRELTDEEYARQLSAELNGHASRSSRSGKAPPGRSKAAGRTPKKNKKIGRAHV